eukprot:3459422-Prymnesium_polylepis.1
MAAPQASPQLPPAETPIPEGHAAGAPRLADAAIRPPPPMSRRASCQVPSNGAFADETTSAALLTGPSCCTGARCGGPLLYTAASDKWCNCIHTGSAPPARCRFACGFPGAPPRRSHTGQSVPLTT